MLDSVLPEPEPLPDFASPAAIIAEAAAALRPPSRMGLPEASAKYRRLNNPGGGYSGPWQNEQVPYLIEPMRGLTDRAVNATIFVGPAQSAKTSALVLNPILHSALADPAPMLVVHMTQSMARDWSSRELDKMIRDCPELRAIARDQNVYDKTLGLMKVAIGWPAPATLAGRPLPRVLLTDYDRMPDDIGDEGSAFDLAQGRVRTFGSRAYVVAESSPSRKLEDASWRPSSPHEGPPVGGIVGLYNRGDRRRWYWPCPDCSEHFEASSVYMSWPDDPDMDAYDVGRAAACICPHCGLVIGAEHKERMNARGLWVPDFCRVQDGKIIGTPPRTNIRSYWLQGPAAALATWASIVTKRVEAERERDRTTDETSLKSVVNVQWGEVFTPSAAKARAEGALASETLVDQAEDYPLGIVPAAARYVVTSVDVQGARFEILHRAFGPNLESWVIGHEILFQAKDGDGADRPINPAIHPQDWDLLINAAFLKVHKLEALPGRGIRSAAVAIDTGGASGVTENAYRFFRRWRNEYGRRIALMKGIATKGAPRVAKGFPDSKRKDRNAGARGEIPVYFFQTDMLKSALDAQLRAAGAGKNIKGDYPAHLPAALKSAKAPHEFFEQMTAEICDDDGRWTKRRPRNEAIDLMTMSYAAALGLRAERIDFENPPIWARPDGGPLGVDLSERAAAEEIAAAPVEPAKPARRGRRVLSRGV